MIKYFLILSLLATPVFADKKYNCEQLSLFAEAIQRVKQAGLVESEARRISKPATDHPTQGKMYTLVLEWAYAMPIVSDKKKMIKDFTKNVYEACIK